MVQGVGINMLKRLRTEVKREYSVVILCLKRQCLMIADIGSGSWHPTHVCRLHCCFEWTDWNYFALGRFQCA
jgi:hypothetical protein